VSVANKGRKQQMLTGLANRWLLLLSSLLLLAAAAAAAAAGLPDAEAHVVGNPTVYSINTAVLAVAAGFAASNPQMVRNWLPQRVPVMQDLHAMCHIAQCAAHLQTWVLQMSVQHTVQQALHRLPAHLPVVLLLLLLLPSQTAGILFKPEFLAAGGAASSLILPLMQILSLGWSAAAVTNFVQGVSALTCSQAWLLRAAASYYRSHYV
jgi:hypothetical protein